MMLKSANVAWIHSLYNVINYGRHVGPRGMQTKEILNQHIDFNMNYPICYHQNRKLSYKFMVAEAYWIINGSMFTDEIVPYNKHIAAFSDDDYIFNGAYGPKFINQVDYIVNTLLKDIHSRQAVMTIWVRNPISSKDIACTVALQFLIRDNLIHTFVTMRSNDLWLGRPYDMFNFTCMTLRILQELNKHRTHNNYIGLGTLHLNVGSSHLYMKDLGKAQNVISQKADKVNEIIPIEAMINWEYLAASLLACMHNSDTKGLWKIRPEK